MLMPGGAIGKTSPPYELHDPVAGVNFRWYLANSVLRRIERDEFLIAMALPNGDVIRLGGKHLAHRLVVIDNQNERSLVKIYCARGWLKDFRKHRRL